MQKSASAGALQRAGAHLSHVPKRAVQHGLFLPTWEVALIDLKPGQTSLQRQVYAEEAKRLEATYLDPDRPVDSSYRTDISNLLTPEAYKNPTQPIKQNEPPAGFGHHKTAHWRSTSHSSINADAIHGAKYHRQHGPSYQAANPPTCVSAATAVSSYSEFHGVYGSNPRDRVHPMATKMPVHKSALTVGTAKGTQHIPGYQGFMATNTSNPYVARVESGASLRSVDKTNLTEQFHTNLLNYSGHVPTNPMNDRGGVQPNMETMMGRSFTAPQLNAFD